MGAYLVVEHIITDAATLEECRTKVEPSIALRKQCTSELDTLITLEGAWPCAMGAVRSAGCLP